MEARPVWGCLLLALVAGAPSAPPAVLPASAPRVHTANRSPAGGSAGETSRWRARPPEAARRGRRLPRRGLAYGLGSGTSGAANASKARSHKPWLLEPPDEHWATPLPPGRPESALGAARDDGGQTHLAIAADRAQWPGLPAVIHSTAAHASRPESLHFHIIVPPGDEAAGARFLRCRGVGPRGSGIGAVGGGHTVSWVPFDGSRVQPLIRVKAKDSQVGNLASALNYARFYLPDLLPRVRTILYLDADAVVLGDVCALLEGLRAQAGGFVAAAVPWDERYRDAYVGHALRAFASRYGFHITPVMRTFNAGVLALDLGAWQAHGLTGEVEWWLALHKQREEPLWDYGTQPVLHMVLYRRWRRMSQAWNVANLGWQRNLSAGALRRVAKARLLHWNGVHKPWREDGFHAELWRPYSGLPECGGRGGCRVDAGPTVDPCP